MEENFLKNYKIQAKKFWDHVIQEENVSITFNSGIVLYWFLKDQEDGRLQSTFSV